MGTSLSNNVQLTQQFISRFNNMKNVLILLVSVLLSACGSGPESIARQYWQGLIEQDRSAVTEASSSRSNQELWRILTPEPTSQVNFGETKIEDNTATVETRLTWQEKDRDEPVQLNLFTVLEKENKQWRVNTARTRQQFFTAVYRTSLQGLSSALAESLASFQILGEEMAGELTRELDRTIDELQEHSNQASDEINLFLESLDEDLHEAIEAMNQEP